MGIIKKIQEANRAGLDFMAEHPAITGIYGSWLLDKILSHEAEPYIHEGKKQGYESASKEYEKKLLELGDKFLEQKIVLQEQRDEYEKLLDEYETEITMLTEKKNLQRKKMSI